MYNLIIFNVFLSPPTPHFARSSHPIDTYYKVTATYDVIETLTRCVMYVRIIICEQFSAKMRYILSRSVYKFFYIFLMIQNERTAS